MLCLLFYSLSQLLEMFEQLFIVNSLMDVEPVPKVGSQQIMEALKEEIKKAGLENEVSVVQTGCHGLCALGPITLRLRSCNSFPGETPISIHAS